MYRVKVNDAVSLLFKRSTPHTQSHSGFRKCVFQHHISMDSSASAFPRHAPEQGYQVKINSSHLEHI